MSTDSRENHINYVEFPVPSAQEFASVKRFYKEVFRMVVSRRRAQGARIDRRG
jgi:predicted enzyme related to lactoylglutathione lyase